MQTVKIEPAAILRVILLAIFLATILAASSTYLALKIGILPSASIPAAILAMAILRLFNSKNIFETNLIQTAASAGEAVAGGIVFTIPALIIIGYWHHFPYWENVAISLLGGLLGILFSIPLRKILIATPQLYFPEAKAIAEILQLGKKAAHIREMLLGSCLGGILEFAEIGLKVVAASFEKFILVGNSTIMGFGIGFSPALLGVGYLIGFNVGLSLFFGALIAWLIILPLLSFFTTLPSSINLAEGLAIYTTDIHYIGLGAMLSAGLWTLLNLLKPFYQSLRLSLIGFLNASTVKSSLSTEQDLPLPYLLVGLLLVIVSIYCLFNQLLPMQNLLASPQLFIIGAVIYVLVIGFIFASICGYFSGLVGVTASPGSAIVISGLLLMALILRTLLLFKGEVLSTQLITASAITIMIGAIVAGAACIANDNIQDLKVGHLIGAAPWQQQLMLILGVIVAALVIPYVMQLLFSVYGLATVLPQGGMDPNLSLPAPPAMMMAGLTQGVFNHDLPWTMFGIGAAIMVILLLLSSFARIKISLLGVGMGIYLPLSSSIPLFIGSVFAFFAKIYFQRKSYDISNPKKLNFQQHYTVLLACGLVAGAALMDVLLAIPMSVSGNPQFFSIMPAKWQNLANLFGFLSVLGLGFSFYWAIKRRPH